MLPPLDWCQKNIDGKEWLYPSIAKDFSSLWLRVRNDPEKCISLPFPDTTLSVCIHCLNKRLNILASMLDSFPFDPIENAFQTLIDKYHYLSTPFLRAFETTDLLLTTVKQVERYLASNSQDAQVVSEVDLKTYDTGNECIFIHSDTQIRALSKILTLGIEYFSGINFVQLTPKKDYENIFEREWEVYGKILNEDINNRSSMNVVDPLALISFKGEKSIYLNHYRNDLFDIREDLSSAEKISILIGVVKGVIFLHSLGYIHGDLKLENVFMEGLTPKLADFGISKRIKSEEKYDGTSGYMPYEVLEANQNKTNLGLLEKTALDAYAFGHFFWIFYFNIAADWHYLEATEPVKALAKMRMITWYPLTFSPSNIPHLIRAAWEPFPLCRISFPEMLTALERIEQSQDPNDSFSSTPEETFFTKIYE